MPAWILLLATSTLVAGCVVDVEGLGASISCSRDADCPRAQRCHPQFQRCGFEVILDEEAPRLVSAVSSGSMGVIIEMSEAVIADDTAYYTLNGGLSVLALAVSNSQQQIELATSPQEPGVEYTLTLSEQITDLAGNSLAPNNRVITFFGGGQPPDTVAPEPIAPASGLRIFETAATLAWTPRTGVGTYSVEVATDAAFASPVAGSPFSVAAPETTLTFAIEAAITYYWRVFADTSAAAGSSTLFHGMSDSLHVYCPEGESCVSGNEAGNVSFPYRSVQRAVQEAATIGLGVVRVASRSPNASIGAAYVEPFQAVSGVDVRGGYDPSFAEAARDWSSHQTIIESPLASGTSAASLSDAVVLEGLTFRAAASASPSKTALLIFDVGEHLQLQNCTVVARNASQLAYGIQVLGTSEAGASRTHPRFVDVTVEYGDAEATAENAAGVMVTNADVTITGGAVVGPNASGSSAGITLDAASAELLNVVVRGGSGATDASRGLWAHGATVALLGGTYTGAAGVESIGLELVDTEATVMAARVEAEGADSVAVGVRTSGSGSDVLPFVMSRSTVHVLGAAARADGLDLAGVNGDLEANRIHAGDDTWVSPDGSTTGDTLTTRGLVTNGDGTFRVVNNVISSGPAMNEVVAVHMGRDMTLVNNTIYTRVAMVPGTLCTPQVSLCSTASLACLNDGLNRRALAIRAVTCPSLT